MKEFDAQKADSQATEVEPISPEAFDFAAYADYEADLAPRAAEFRSADSGVMVHRRMRVREVFTYGCRDMEQSLALQLGALKKSIDYRADLPNFIEPWYGIGTVAASFGCDYSWPPGQAPTVTGEFNSVEEALAFEDLPVAETDVGKRTVAMVDYFLEQTGGRLPMSLCDVQSPLNTAGGIVEMNAFFMSLMTEPDAVKELLDRIANRLIEFSRLLLARLGECAVYPGHGFASSRHFKGIGMSDDNVLMLSPEQYREYAAPSLCKVGDALGGTVFHSCGDWSGYADAIRTLPGLRMVDAAFSSETDPSPNPPEAFREAFAGSGVVVNARMVGSPDVVEDVVRRLWTHGMKLIVVTYCQTPEEQAEAYRRIRAVCC